MRDSPLHRHPNYPEHEVRTGAGVRGGDGGPTSSLTSGARQFGELPSTKVVDRASCSSAARQFSNLINCDDRKERGSGAKHNVIIQDEQSQAYAVYDKSSIGGGGSVLPPGTDIDQYRLMPTGIDAYLSSHSSGGTSTHVVGQIGGGAPRYNTFDGFKKEADFDVDLGQPQQLSGFEKNCWGVMQDGCRSVMGAAGGPWSWGEHGRSYVDMNNGAYRGGSGELLQVHPAQRPGQVLGHGQVLPPCNQGMQVDVQLTNQVGGGNSTCMLSPPSIGEKSNINNNFIPQSHSEHQQAAAYINQNFSPNHAAARSVNSGGSECTHDLNLLQNNYMRSTGLPPAICSVTIPRDSDDFSGGDRRVNQDFSPIHDAAVLRSHTQAGGPAAQLSPLDSVPVASVKCRYPSGTTPESIERERLMYQDSLALFRCLTASFRELDDIMNRVNTK